jgi:hypothetical protein
VYAFANIIDISQVIIGSGGVGVFTYAGVVPVINEGFVLSGFILTASFLNGQTVYVLSANATTFTALVSGPSGTYESQNGIGTSTTGIFVGPNAPTTAEDVNTAGVPWNNPQGILGDTSYATVFTGTTLQTGTPTVFAQSGTGSGWENIPKIVSTNPSFTASTTMSTGHGTSNSLIITATGLGLTVPSSAVIQGVSVAFNASASAPSGFMEVTLTTFDVEGSAIIPITPGMGLQPYVAGSSTYLWDAALTPAIVNASSFGVNLSGSNHASTDQTFTANGLKVTVYYTLDDSDELYAQTFNFTLNPNTGITGIETTFRAFSSTGTSSVIVQLLKNGVPVGTPKEQALTTVPTVYSLGSNLDSWGTTWLYSDINSLSFGVSYVATGSGVTSVQDGDLIIYITPGLDNFNYIKTYIQNNQQINTLALDASGNIWLENATENPGVLSLALTGIIPGSFAQSATADGNEYLMFSNLAVGTDRPRVVYPNQTTGQLQFLPLSQVGPGQPPTVQAFQGNPLTSVLTLLTWSLNGNTASFTFTPATYTTITGAIYIIAGTHSILDNQPVTVLTGSTPGTFTASTTDPTFSAAPISGTGGTATQAPGYVIANILESAPAGVQNGATPFNGQMALLSAGPGQSAIGTTVTYYYGGPGAAEDATLVAAFNANPSAVYVYLDSATPFLGGTTVQVLAHSTGKTINQAGNIPYFTVATTLAPAAQAYSTPSAPGIGVGPGNNGNFQVTMATLVTAEPVPLSAGDTVTITGAVPAGWNQTWTIIKALNSGTLDVVQTSAVPGTVTIFYTPTNVPPVLPIVGDTVSITNCTNALFINGLYVVATVGAGFFTVSNPAATALPLALDQAGVVVIYGTQFLFDPGSVAAGEGTAVPSIFGPPLGPSYTPDSGTLVIAGGAFTGIGSGTRQLVVFFITETYYWTQPSPPVTFDISGSATYINITQIPIGPPNVIARGLAFTESGQNGVPGANFYAIENAVVQTLNGVTTTLADSTIINDNVTTSAKLTFTDAVLLESTEIDIQGADLFNLIELGSSAWVVPYASRNFYGMQLNKVTEFNNLSFDGGYLTNATTAGGLPSNDVFLLGGTYSNLQPCGWTILDTFQDTLVVSPVTGDALYIKSLAAGITPVVGLVYQSAYQDAYQVPILNINTTYSLRVAVSNPSGIAVGNLIIDLTDISNGQYGQTYGIYTLPLSSMTTNVQVFTGTLLTTPFPIVGTLFQGVSPNLKLRVYGQNLAQNADILIDRIEVFPTLTPYLLPQVYGSYANDPEAVDASDSGGIIDTTSENSQTCYGGFVMHDLLYLLKLNSWYSTEQNPNSEPGGWALKEVSNKVGTCGIHAYDTGEEWAMTACREGIFGFNGGQPVKLTLEVFNLWNCINWDAADTIVLCNDVANKRFYCLVPLPTGTSPEGVPTATVQWLPNAPYNPLPTTPNLMIMCNYQGLDTAAELFAGPGIHVTMFGSLAAMDMKRKWTIWQIPSPFAAFITQQNGVDMPLYICNGIASSKIYQLETTQLSDDGVPINSLYTTYGHVNAVKAATQPIFGMHTKRYTVLQGTVEGAGVLGVRILPNVINPKYPYSVPVGVKLVSPAMDDFFRPINVKAQRAFLEFSTNAVGSWFHLDKTLLTGKADPWSSLNPTGGMNNGIAS